MARMGSFLFSILNLRNSVGCLLRRIKSKYLDGNSPDLGELLLYDGCPSLPVNAARTLPTIRDLIGDGFLYAVPKKRRSLEKRLTRKHGFGKMLLPKKSIACCDICGSFHIVNTVCGGCYDRVKKETEAMQEAIFKELKLDPIDKEVVVLYKDDPRDEASVRGKRIIELEKERPAWFGKNLLQRDSGTNRDKTKDISQHQPQPVVKT